MNKRLAATLGAGVVLLVAACSDAPRASQEQRIPPEVREFADDWPLPGRDYMNSHATKSSRIDSSNVATLATAWQVAMPGRAAFGNFSTTPLIAEDTIYVEDLSSTISAIDRETGAVRWSKSYPGFIFGPNGVALGWGKIFAIRRTDGVVALDASTGDELWARSLVATTTQGVDVRAGNGTRRIAVATGKLGTVIGHDIDSGAVLWTTPVGVHQNDDLTMLTGPTEVLPGTFGGVLTPPAAADGVVYVAVLNSPSVYDPGVPNSIGGSLGAMPGQVVAIDAADGTILWDVPVPGDPTGGATVVNDLVLTATLQGQVFALDRANGAVVWSWNAPGGINGWPAVAGDLITWPVGLPNPALLVALRLPRA